MLVHDKMFCYDTQIKYLDFLKKKKVKSPEERDE